MAHRPHRSADQWQQLIEQHGRSAQSARAFCLEHDIGYASFMQWRSRLFGSRVAVPACPDRLPEFVELTVPPDDAAPVRDKDFGSSLSLLIELELGGGCLLRISRSA